MVDKTYQILSIYLLNTTNGCIDNL